MGKEQLDQHNMDLEKAKELTVEEAVRKEAELKAGVTEADGVLDKYIKQNREQVASQKFENTKDLTEVKTGVDRFIEEQRQEVEGTEESPEVVTVISSVEPEEAVESSKETEMEIDQMPPTIGLTVEEARALSRPFYKKKGFWIGLVALLVLGSGGTYVAWNQQSRDKEANQAEVTESTTEATTEDKKADDTKVKAFEDLYATFFVDKEQTKLKNSTFGELPKLEKALNALEGTDAYDDAKAQYDRLAKSIDAIKSVNDKFETPAIVDGEKVDATLKSGATFDDLSSDVLATGNAALDTLVQAVVTDGRKQLSGEATPATNSRVAGSTSGSVEQAAPAAPAENTTPANPGAVTVDAGNAATLYGITDYNVATLQRDKSRVPYNFEVIADGTNPGWTFNPGVLEKVVATAQNRGYISGNQYILEKVNVINGNGYYNMFKPDGTYLFSINAKTGYFVGNAKGHSDNLDF